MHQHLTLLNFHDHTLIAANESQNISETSNSDQSLSSASTSREKMKDFLENRHNKKIERKLSKEQKVATSEEQKFQEKLLESMEHQDKTFNETLYSLQRNMAHLTQTVSQTFVMMPQAMNQGSFSTPTPATPRQDFPSFSITPRFISPVTPSSNFDYYGGLTNNNENNSSSKNDLSGKTDDHTEDQNPFFHCGKTRKTKYGSSPLEVLFKKGVLQI